MIIIESKRKKQENILKKYPGAVIVDVTSKATDGLVKLSPFYPHGDIPVPFSQGYTATWGVRGTGTLAHSFGAQPLLSVFSKKIKSYYNSMKMQVIE